MFADLGQPTPCGLPTALASATQLQYIDFGVSGGSFAFFDFGQLPETFLCNLTSVTKLALQNCGVDGEFPSSISCLTGLREFDILCARRAGARPQLDLPAEITVCRSLSSLVFSTSSISPSVWKLSALQELTIDQSSPAATDLQLLSRLQRLRSFRLCNSGDALQDALPALTAPSGLTSLILDRSGLVSVPRLEWITQLKELDLKSNRCDVVLRCPGCA